MKKSTLLKKSLLSLLILCSITASLMAFESYKLQQKATSFSQHLSRYVVPVRIDGQPLMYFQEVEDNSLLTTDAQQLAAIAENNLIANNQANDSAVYFALSSSTIEPQYKLKLLDIVQKIETAGQKQIWQVVGQTDKSGSATYNITLAKIRAEKVAEFLIKNGVDQKQLSVVTLGEYKAMQLANSTYNDNLRKVEVVKYQPALANLSTKVANQTKVQNKLQSKRHDKQIEENSKALINTKSALVSISKDKMLDTKKLIEKQDDIEHKLLLADQQQQQRKILTIKSELVAKNNVVQVNSDLQLHELEMLEGEQHLWLTEQLLREEKFENDKSQTQALLDQKNTVKNSKPTAMVSQVSYLF